jgi:hypothetical protein
MIDQLLLLRYHLLVTRALLASALYASAPEGDRAEREKEWRQAIANLIPVHDEVANAIGQVKA